MVGECQVDVVAGRAKAVIATIGLATLTTTVVQVAATSWWPILAAVHLIPGGVPAEVFPGTRCWPVL